MRRLLCLLSLSLLATSSRAAGDIFPLAEVRKDQDATVLTVLEGDTIVAIPARVVGVVQSYMGPGRDIVLIELLGEKARHDGVVHGMSGSPVQIGDRVLGALSLALSPFPKDPIAGVTPLADMLRDAGRPGPGTAPPARGAGEARPLLSPLRSPLLISGVNPGIVAAYAPRLEALGLAPVFALGGSAPRAATAAAEGAALAPGAAVAAVLADGDFVVGATGTVTYREGARVYGFGHPFTKMGRVAFAMAPADIVTTLADQTYSYKVANIGAPVGSIVFDRTSGVVGEIGALPRFIDVHVNVRRRGETLTQTSFRVVDERWVAAAVVEMLIAGTLDLRWQYDLEATYEMSSLITLRSGAAIELRNSYAVAPDPLTASPQAAAKDIGAALLELYASPYAQDGTRSVVVDYEISEAARIVRLESIDSDQHEPRAGRDLSVTVQVRDRDGTRRRLPARIPMPVWTRGATLFLRAADRATRLAETEQMTGGLAGQVESEAELTRALARRPRADRVYLQLLAPTPGAAVRGQPVHTLPGNVRSVLSRADSSFRLQPRAVLWEVALDASGVVFGNREVMITVR